jgi:hypothetical protein
VLPKLRHLEVHAVWSPLAASLGYALPIMRAYDRQNCQNNRFS